MSHLLLPVELIERILRNTWSSDLSTHERISLFTSICLVNHTFLALFIPLALTDVHITTSSYARHYLRLIRARFPIESNSNLLLPGNAFQSANSLCRSITFHVDASSTPATSSAPRKPAIKLYSAGDSSAQAISSTLDTLIVSKSSVPNLRHVSIEYTDWGFDDLFSQNRLTSFPKQVTELTVRFRFSAALHNMKCKSSHATCSGKSVLEDLRWRYEMMPHPFGRFAMPNVQRLNVLGATTSFAAGMLEACSGAETVMFDEHVQLPVVPPWIRTVVIKDMRRLRSSKGEVRSGNHDTVRKGLEKFCGRKGISFIEI
ncbi:hypothetical protein BC835DRAFT_1410385 [Cytidiella melzeri]|nr:hypothetical protein BC835DRAFT_1410385 [Cytidiella melzeri]